MSFGVERNQNEYTTGARYSNTGPTTAKGMWKQLDIKGRRHGFYIYTHTRPRHSAQSGRGATTAYITTTYRSPCLANCSEASAAAVSKKNERKTAKKTKEISASATAHACRASHAAGRSHAPPTAGGQLAVQTAVGNALPEQTDWREESTVAWRLIFSTRKKEEGRPWVPPPPPFPLGREGCVCVCYTSYFSEQCTEMEMEMEMEMEFLALLKSDVIMRFGGTGDYSGPLSLLPPKWQLLCGEIASAGVVVLCYCPRGSIFTEVTLTWQKIKRYPLLFFSAFAFLLFAQHWIHPQCC